MARDFEAGDTERFDFTTGFVSTNLYGASALSIHMHIRPETVTGNPYMWSHKFSTTADSMSLYLDSSSYIKIGGRSRRADSFQSQAGTTALVAGNDYWVGGTLDYAGDYVEVYLNGVSEGAGSATFGLTTHESNTHTNGPQIGASANISNYFDGAMSHVAIWTARLTDEEFAALGKGFSPLFVRRESLVDYWSMEEESGNIVGLKNNWVGTETSGTIDHADGPAIIQPSQASEIVLPRWPYIEGTLP